MPSSLTRVISITLVCSTCPPVSVLVQARAPSLEAFLGGMASGTRRLRASWHRTSGYAAPDLPRATPTCLPQDNHRLGSHSLPRPPIGQMEATWYRNINLLAIDYAFRPRLRSRLTLSRRTLLRNPWAIGGGDSHPPCATHAGILTSHASTASLPLPLQSAWERSPTTPSKLEVRSFGSWLEPRYIVRARTLDQ